MGREPRKKNKKCGESPFDSHGAAAAAWVALFIVLSCLQEET
jgi:hypothetical protein